MLLKGIAIALACVAALELPRDQIVPEDEELLEHIPGFVSSLAGAAEHPSGCEVVPLLHRISSLFSGNLPSADLQRQHVN